MGTRRDALFEIAGFATAAGVGVVGLVQPALAEPVVTDRASAVPAKWQRTATDKLDINNCAVVDYMQLPGMYPTIGGKIANNGPYGSVKDVYKLKMLSKAEIKQIKEYESKLTATPSTGLDTLRGRDPYRRSFNK